MAVDLATLERATMRDKRKARDELQRIKEENGEKLIPDEVVTAAADRESPLHLYFEWDDSVAGHQYRLTQARQLIRVVETTFPEDKGGGTGPKYVSLASDRREKGGGYRETVDVLDNAELLAELERTAKRDIEGVLRRYEMLEELVKNVRELLEIEAAATSKKTKGGKKKK